MDAHEIAVKKNNRQRLFLFLGILLVALVLLGIFLYGALQYTKTDFAVILSQSGDYSVSDGILFPKSGVSDCASYNTDTGILHSYPTEKINLSEYGLSGEAAIFRYRPNQEESGGRILPCDEAQIPLSRANTDKVFVYTHPETAQKYRIDTENKTALPLFYGSCEGVDPYGESITCFSYGGGLLAAGDENHMLVLYLREDAQSLAATKKLGVDLSAHCVEFSYYFVNERYLQIIGTAVDGKPVYLLCDAKSGTLKGCPREEGKVYDTPALYTPYSEGFLQENIPAENQPDDRFVCRYINLSLGTEYSLSLEAGTKSASLLALSPNGAYALCDTSTEENDHVLSVCRASSAPRALAPCFPENTRFESAVFLSANILFVRLLDTENAPSFLILKICN